MRSEDPNFESLLETEPVEAPSLFPSRRAEERWLQGRDLGTRAQALEDAARRAEAFGYDSLAGVIRDMKLETAPRPSALASAADRIKDLEGVLTGIGQLARSAKGGDEARLLGDIIKLINETLDPCKPWCTMEPGHEGACLSGSSWEDEG